MNFSVIYNPIATKFSQPVLDHLVFKFIEKGYTLHKIKKSEYAGHVIPLIKELIFWKLRKRLSGYYSTSQLSRLVTNQIGADPVRSDHEQSPYADSPFPGRSGKVRI